MRDFCVARKRVALLCSSCHEHAMTNSIAIHVQHKDILQLMIDANGEESDSDGEREAATQPPVECPAHKNKTTKTKFMMSDEEVVANSIGFLLAGNETTAITLSYASYELALNSDVQEKLQLEIDAYFEDKPVS